MIFFLLLKKYKFKTLKASSLLESVIAMFVISVCSLVAIKIYVSVLSNSYKYDYLYATSKINDLIFKTQQNKTIDNEEFNFEDFKIIKTIELVNDKVIKVQFLGILSSDTIKKSIKIYK